jgi:hypothetical protein
MQRSAVVLLSAALCSAHGAAAQVIPTTTRSRPPVSDLLSQPVLITVAPSYAWHFSSGARSGVDARLTWGVDAKAAIVPELSLDLAGARSRGAGYTRSGIGTRVVARGLPFSPWAGATAGVGSGAGPTRVLMLHGGAGAGAVNLEVRTTWFNSKELSRDSLIFGLVRESALFDSSYTDVEASWERVLGRVDFRMVSGMRFGSSWGQQQWAFSSVTVPVFARVGLALSGGWQPAMPERAQRGGRFGMLSLVFRTPQPQTNQPPAPKTAVLTATAADPGRYLLSLTVRKARSVRIKGDLTNWETIEMQRDNGDVWQVELPAAPGVYKINLSIDQGAWLVPAGLIAVPDGFGGSAGVLNLN